MNFREISPLAPTRMRQKKTKGNKNQKWTMEDDEKLTNLVKSKDMIEINWHTLTLAFPDKSSQQIMERWKKVLDPSITKGSWTGEEDAKIINYVSKYGTKSWTKLASTLPGRVGKQCRERWAHHLDPRINHGPWTPEEDMQIINLHAKYGNKWALFAVQIPNRTDNSIKNRWHSTLSKRIENSPLHLQDQNVIPEDDATLSSSLLSMSSKNSDLQVYPKVDFNYVTDMGNEDTF